MGLLMSSNKLSLFQLVINLKIIEESHDIVSSEGVPFHDVRGITIGVCVGVSINIYLSTIDPITNACVCMLNDLDSQVEDL